MNGTEFVNRVRKLGKQRGVAVEFVAVHGKGSHGRLYYGAEFTTVKDRHKELKKGALHGMIKQLGLKPSDIL